MKQWKRLAALSSAIVMAAATLTYFPSDTLQNIRLEISASADETGAETTTEPQVWIEDNLTWTLTADGTLTISGEGAMKDYNSDDNPSPVYNNSDVKKVVIEDGVTSIGNSAFDSCRNLTSVTIPDSVTSIGKDAFEACNSLSSITLSNNITSIGDAAFYDCSNLKSITIPDSVTSIESAVFYNCTSLTSITIPNSVTSIGSYAFSDCSSLTSITIPDSVTSIGTRVFYNCTSLTSITIPDSVTSIGYNVFESCSSLTSITIPKSVTIIGSGVFDKCNNLTVYLESGSTLTSNALGVDESKIVSYWNEDNLTWKLDANGTLTISGTGAMKDYDYDSNPSPVYNNSDVKKIVIEDGVTSIGNFAFHSCSSLPSITIPDSVTSIGNFAFESCNSLSSITLSNNITSIGDFAFHGCPLTSITLPDSVTSIGYAAFHSCSNLKSITIPDSVTSIESAVFYNCTSLKTISLSCKSSLKKSDFGDQSDLVSASHTLKKTEAKAATCSEDGNKEYWTCEYCGKYFLSDDANPETAKAVEQSECMIPAIQHKNATTRGALEPTETAPGYSGDRYCPDCDKVVEKGYTYWIEGNLTWKLYEDGTLNISGTGAMKNYNNTDNLSPVHMNSSVKKIVIEEGVTSIGNAAFSGCISLTNITIPDGVTSIGIMVFYNCTSLTSITIPDSVTSIGNSAFNSCTSLTSITIPDSVTRIGKYAFYDCSSLTSITIPDSVTSIGESVFSFCSSLTSITIPDSVTSIGNSAFYGCSSLKTISLSCKSSLKRSDFGDQANLVSYTSHTLNKTEAKAATCTENGNIEHWTCEHCGKYFLSDDSNPETAKAVELSEITIPNIKHNYDKNGFCKNDDTHYQPATYNEESEKYEISNAGQLYWFAEQVNSGNASLNAVLTTDIVVNETVLAADGSLGADPDTLRMWRSIGDDAENIFKGTFDGQGHTISGLYFSNDSNESDVMCASLFGLSAGIIQNVGLEDSYLNHYNISAGICASNNGQIVNCYNAGTILGYCASGICIENSDNGSIENCYNTGVIRGFGLVAGICNMNAGSMKDCYNNNDIIVMTDSTIIDENDEKSYASGICNINGSSGRIENCYHVGQVSGADVNNNICNLNAGQIENSYYDCNICDKDAITQNESSAVVKNVESKTTKQFASGEVTYLLNGDQSVRAFYQNLAKEKYPTLNQKSKVVMQLEMIYDESFGEDATTNKIYHIAGDTIALETSPDKAYTYQYFVNGKQIEKPNYTLTGNTKMTVKRVPVEIELSEIDTIQLTCQKKMTLDLTEYLKNFADLKPVQFQLDADSKLPDGLKLTEDGMLSGTPKKAATVKTTIVLTAENDSTKEMNLVFIVNAPVTTTTTTITTTTTTKATTTTKPSKTTTTKVTTTTKPNKTTTTKATTTTTTTISSYGDVNLDGMVDILDAVFLNKYLATLIQFSDAQMANADCCQDGVLNDQDTTALMQFIILLIDDLPVQPTEK